MVGRYSGTKSINTEETLIDKESLKSINAYEYFLEYLYPDAIIYGMSYDEFWNKDPQLFYSFRFSFIEKTKIEFDLRNQDKWLQGLYNYRALNTALYNTFKEKKDEPQSYLTEPINFDQPIETPLDKAQKEYNKKTNWSRLKERSANK